MSAYYVPPASPTPSSTSSSTSSAKSAFAALATSSYHSARGHRYLPSNVSAVETLKAVARIQDVGFQPSSGLSSPAALPRSRPSLFRFGSTKNSRDSSDTILSDVRLASPSLRRSATDSHTLPRHRRASSAFGTDSTAVLARSSSTNSNASYRRILEPASLADTINILGPARFACDVNADETLEQVTSDVTLASAVNL